MDQIDQVGRIEDCSSRDLFREIPLCRDSEKLFLDLQDKVERIEKNAEDLYSVLEYLTKDEDIIRHFSKIEPFPIPTVKGSLRHLVWTLEEQIRDLEGFQGDEIPDVNPMFGLKSATPKSRNSSTIPTINIEEDDSEGTAVMNVHAYPIIKNEVEEMVNQLSEWHKTNEDIIAVLHQVKGLQHPPNVVCDCLQDVNAMRQTLNILTGGRYLKGLEIEFVNPRLMKLIESRLRDSRKFLREIVELLNELDRFLRQLMALKHMFMPYLGRTPIIVYNEQPYIGLDRLLEALNIIIEDMAFIDEILDQLLVSGEERDERIGYMKNDIEWCHKVKLDKEEVEDILSEKADLSEMDNKISQDVFSRLVNSIAGNLYTSTGELILQEALWCSIMDDMKEKLQKKARKSKLTELTKTICCEVCNLTEKIEDIKSNIKPEQKEKRLRYGKCASCGIVMPFQCNEEKRIATRQTSKLKATLLDVKKELKKTKRTVERLRKGGSCSKFLDERELYTYKRPNVVHDRCKTSLRYCGGSYTVLPPEQRVDHECGETEYQFEVCIDTSECMDARKKQDARFIPLTSYDKYPRTCYGFKPLTDEEKTDRHSTLRKTSVKSLKERKEPIKPRPTPAILSQAELSSPITETELSAGSASPQAFESPGLPSPSLSPSPSSGFGSPVDDQPSPSADEPPPPPDSADVVRGILFG